MWRLPELQKLSGMRGVRWVVLDQCAYGGMARKRTALLTNAPWLAGLSVFWPVCHQHGQPRVPPLSFQKCFAVLPCRGQVLS